MHLSYNILIFCGNGKLVGASIFSIPLYNVHVVGEMRLLAHRDSNGQAVPIALFLET